MGWCSEGTASRRPWVLAFADTQRVCLQVRARGRELHSAHASLPPWAWSQARSCTHSGHHAPEDLAMVGTC